MERLHPLYTDIDKPERFTYPFCYEPHPLCQLAASEVQEFIATHAEIKEDADRGKMFGVLVVENGNAGNYGYLAAYSGLLAGRNDWPFFVPPVYDAQQPDGYFKTTEREISRLSKESSRSGESGISKEMSQDLQRWLFHQYQLLNARGEVKDLVDIWQSYHTREKLRSKYSLPPGGTGDCCAPKLLQYAYQQGLRPVCMAEFWWGKSPKGLVRHHGQYYPACSGKCKPVLAWMLQGLEVDDNPNVLRLQRHEPRTIWEDEAVAVVDKPAGMLSMPGKIGGDSVASWAQERWPGSMLVHRLDMLTSGILLVAKTTDAYHRLQKQFEERTVKKKYLAMVEGVPKEEHGIVDLPLSSDALNRPYQTVDCEHGKRAVTEYRVVARGATALLALWPHTGRTHQLRVHCAHPEGLGCPIVGDELYGRKADRLYLQAQAISFVHPTTGKKMHFELPAEFGT